LIRGDVGDVNQNSDAPVLVRMHAHCLMGDVFGSPVASVMPHWRAHCDGLHKKGAGL